MRGRVNAIRTFKGLVVDLRFIFLIVKLLCRFKEQGYAFFFTISLSAYPMLTKFLFRIVYKSFAWVCHIDGVFPFFVLFYLIDNDKMVLIPMDNTCLLYTSDAADE